MERIDPRWREAVELFNRGEYFLCHDLLEEIWSETHCEERAFWQGCLHAAVALFHLEGQNYGGARKMYDSALNYLAPFGDAYQQLDLHRFREDLRSTFAPLLEPWDSYPTGLQVNPEDFPRMYFLTGRQV